MPSEPCTDSGINFSLNMLLLMTECSNGFWVTYGAHRKSHLETHRTHFSADTQRTKAEEIKSKHEYIFIVSSSAFYSVRLLQLFS